MTLPKRYYTINKNDKPNYLMLKDLLKRIFPGVSWQNPVVNTVFKMMDPFDWVSRSLKGLGHLPPYSIRVRSAGVNRQFGGTEFLKVGRKIRDLLVQHASLQSTSKVLEIGCGSGRTAFVLSENLDNGNFYGMDIEEVALLSCRKNAFLTAKEFQFDLLDVQNDEFNPNGQFAASEYRFPYEDNTFDAIFLVSVFTHMLTEDVNNYIGEISRLLKPGGSCLVTTFLVDDGTPEQKHHFPFREQEHYYRVEAMPEIAVGFSKDYFAQQFNSSGMQQSIEPLIGSWRENGSVENSSGVLQDIIIYKKS